MPKFILDTTGAVQTPEIRWADLDTFTQGYIEAAFFTSTGPDNPEMRIREYIGRYRSDDVYRDAAFSDLAPETLATMIADCAKFCEGSAWLRAVNAAKYYDFPGEEQAGRDFWLTRNGHGCGFWNGDWPEPHGEALTDAAKAFPERDLYVGDDGKVYL